MYESCFEGGEQFFVCGDDGYCLKCNLNILFFFFFLFFYPFLPFFTPSWHCHMLGCLEYAYIMNSLIRNKNVILQLAYDYVIK